MDVDELADTSSKRIDQYTQTTSDLERVELLVNRTTKSERTCIVCGCSNTINRHRLTNQQRNLVFLKKGIFVSPNSRCCKTHLYNRHLTYEALEQIKSGKSSVEMWGAQEITQCLDGFRVIANSSKSNDFDDPSSMSDADYLTMTGLNKDNFNHLLQFLTTMRTSRVRSLREALAIYLMKLRLSVSNSVLATIFRLRNKRAVSRILQQVRQSLGSNFTPTYLGLSHINREEVLAHHQTAIANTLLTSQLDQVCVAIDGTYLYIQKSSNNTFQRRTYSMHKHRNLIKPMIITATDGYILAVFGPFLADHNNNDASIIKHCLFSNEQDMLSWFKDNDVMIIDRGVCFAQLGEKLILS
ncbi:unnamed protein product [Adineta ricciae]|nr:unnamed protein product [Adineta ricciae]